MKPKILVVDDEWSMRELLRNTLSLAGFEVSMAADETEFREQVLTQKPNIIILDIVLGEKDGTEVYQQLLKEGLDRSIPVVFLTALAGDRPVTPPRANRRYALVGKPFDSDQFVREIQEMVESQESD